MPTISFYDQATGRLDGWLEAPDDVLDLNKSGKAWIDGKFRGDTHYVTEGEPALRPAMPAALAGQTITQIPAGAVLTINGGKAYTVNDGTADLQFDQPGTYTVQLSCWPYLDAEFTIENPAP